MSVANRLRGDREIAARGQLSLDREKAREKLRMFRLADPHFYVLQFVRAASVLGASKIVFEISAREMTCHFDREIPSELLADIWSVAFEQRKGAAAQAAHYVALGLGSAQALDPKNIEIRSGGFRLCIEGEEETETHGRYKQPGTLIYVREKFRFGHVLEFFSSIGGEHAEMVALRNRCEFALLPVMANRQLLQRDVARPFRYVQTIDGPTERGVVAINPLLTGQGWCVVLRDSVAIGRQPIEVHGTPAVGVLQSSRVRTDLSGLGPIADDAWVEVIEQVFMPHYHLALRLCLQEAEPYRCLEALHQLLGYVRVNRAEFETDALLQWLFDLPLFDVATGPGVVSLSAALSDDRTLRFARSRFAVEVEGPPILLIERTQGAGVEGIQERTAREAVLAALRRMPDIAVRDRTHELQRRVRAGRNEALWRSRPLRKFPTYPLQETVTVEGALGNVFIPVDSPADAPKTSEIGFSVFVNSRLLHHQTNKIGLGIGFDGDFPLNGTYDGLEITGRQSRLASALCARTLSLYQAYAEALTAADVEEQARPRVLDEFVERLLDGSWSQAFFEAVGYLPSRTTRTLREQLTRIEWFVGARPTSEVIERLGPIARVRSYELADGGRCSLADIAQSEELSLLRPAGNWRSFLNVVTREFGRSALTSIILVDEVQATIVRSICPEVRDARLALEQVRAEKDYMARPTHDGRLPPGLVAAEAGVDRRGVKIELRLVPTDALRTCETVFVWRERVLATHDVSVKRGAFRAVVTSEQFVPMPDYQDVETGPWLEELLETITAAAHELVDKWWVERRASSSAVKSSELELLWSLALARARYEADVPMIPVLRRGVGTWTEDWASRTELRELAAAHGLVVACTRTRRLSPGAVPKGAEVVIRIAAGEKVRRLRGLLGEEVKVVDATPTDQSSADAYAAFRRTDMHPQRIRGGTVSWKGEIRGLRYHCAMFPDASAGTAKQVNLVTVLYERRALEKLEVEVPFGQFRCIIEGEMIEPDPSYSFVASGRAEVLDVARRAAAATIREACRLITVAGGPAGDLALIGPDLERMLEICQVRDPEPPFDLRVMLLSSPLRYLDVLSELFEVLDVDELEESSDEIEALESHLAAPEPAPPDRAERADPLLADVIDMLLGARGERRDLFDDHLARAFEWESLDGPLCRVSNASVAIDPAHALVRRAREIGDRGAIAFLASAVYSQINAHYRRIADHDELELQARLVRSLRG